MVDLTLCTTIRKHPCVRLWHSLGGNRVPGTNHQLIDTMAECIHTRFNQKDFKVYQNIEELLLKAVASKDHGEELVYRDTDLQ